MITEHLFICNQDVMQNDSRIFTKGNQYSVDKEEGSTVVMSNDKGNQQYLYRTEFCTWFNLMKTT